jgi:molybdopterin converting factor subunit 1
MEVRVLAFAAAANRLGWREQTLALPEGATVANALARLEAEQPDFAQAKEGLSTAVNMAYVGADQTLRGGDELALIPPVSGG